MMDSFTVDRHAKKAEDCFGFSFGFQSGWGSPYALRLPIKKESVDNDFVYTLDYFLIILFLY